MMDAKDGALHTLLEQMEPLPLCIPCSGDLNPEHRSPDAELNGRHILRDMPTGTYAATVKPWVESRAASRAYAAVGWGKRAPDAITDAR